MNRWFDAQVSAPLAEPSVQLAIITSIENQNRCFVAFEPGTSSPGFYNESNPCQKLQLIEQRVA
jgi:hypothetical protein